MLTPGLAHASACYIGADGGDQLVFVGDSFDASTARIVGPMGALNIETLAKDPVSKTTLAFLFSFR